MLGVSSGDLFFFYGLLKQGANGGPKHINLEAGGAFLGTAFVRGDLYDVGGYPGIVEGNSLVKGVLYRIHDLSLVPRLDEFEDVIEDDEAASLYLRKKRPVVTENAQTTSQTAWVYWFNQAVQEHRKISNGEWPLGNE